MRVLHHYWLSSGSRFCRLLLAESKFDALQKLECWWERSKNFLAINPGGTVPVLIEDDGTVLVGIWPIIEYFEETAPESSLLPGTPAQRAEIRRLTGWFSDKFEKEVVMPIVKEKFLSRITGDGVPSSTVLRVALANLQVHMQYLNYLADSRRWVAGSKMSVADLHAAASLSVVDFFGDIDWDKYPEAKIWYARMKSRPSFRPLLADTVTGITPPAHYTNLDF